MTICPTCGHSLHRGHQYDEPRHCDGCKPCREFRNRYNQLTRWHRDVDDMLAEMDAEFTMRQTAIAQVLHGSARRRNNGAGEAKAE